jgi:hypothetical protein
MKNTDEFWPADNHDSFQLQTFPNGTTSCILQFYHNTNNQYSIFIQAATQKNAPYTGGTVNILIITL